MPTPAKADLPPVDPNTPLPPSVAAQAAKAEALHKASYANPEAPQPDQTPAPAPDNQPAPQPVPQPAPPSPVQSTEPPAPVQPQPAPSADAYPDKNAQLSADQWRHQYLSMKGRYEQSVQSIGALQEQLSEMGDELSRSIQNRTARPANPAPQPVQPLVTPEEISTYSPELIDVVKRAAREAVMPDLQNVHNSVQRVNQQVQRVSTETVYETLARAVPDWQAINVSQRFREWCSKRDVYSNALRGNLLKAAFQAADAPRVVAFFKGFLQEEQATGQLPDPSVQPAPPAPVRQPAMSLESLVAPGRAHPAGGDTQLPVEKPIFSRQQISAFYTQVRQGYYAGREQEKAQLEQAIFLAQREGRVR